MATSSSTQNAQRRRIAHYSPCGVCPPSPLEKAIRKTPICVLLTIWNADGIIMAYIIYKIGDRYGKT